MYFTIYWKDGLKEFVGPLGLAKALKNRLSEIYVWTSGYDNSYVWNRDLEEWVKLGV